MYVNSTEWYARFKLSFRDSMAVARQTWWQPVLKKEQVFFISCYQAPPRLPVEHSLALGAIMKTLLYVFFNILIGQKATWVTPAAWPAGRGWWGSSHPAEGGAWRERFCNWCLSLATWGQSGEKNDSGVIVIHSRLRFKVCPEGTLLFQAINGRPKRKRVWVCERNRRND